MNNIQKEWEEATPTALEKEWDSASPETSSLEDIPLRDVPGKMLSNLGESASSYGKNIYQAMRHPVNAVNTMADIFEGGVQGRLVEDYQPKQEEDIRRKESFDAFKQMLADRYGGYENIKRTIATDPVGSLADVSSLATGGGGIMAKIPGTMGRIGTAARTAGQAMEPLSIVGKGAGLVAKGTGKVASGTLGFTTGAGKESIDAAYRAGREKLPEFAEGMRGKIPGMELRETAKTSLQAIKNERARDYQTRLASITADTQTLDFTPVKERMKQLEKMYNIKRKRQPVDPDTGIQPPDELDFSRSTLDRNAVNDVDNIIRTIEDWGSQQGDFTPVGMDILKRKLDDFYTESRNSKGLVTSLKNIVKDSIIEQVPAYKEMLSNYENTSMVVKDIETSLSLGTKAGSETGIRKLVSALKDDNEFRMSMVKVLDDTNGGKLAEKIAGMNLSKMSPQSLMGKGIDIAAIGSLFYGMSPKMVIAMGMAAPRVVGELAYILGKASRRLEQMKRLFPAGLRQGAFQSGRIMNTPQMTQ